MPNRALYPRFAGRRLTEALADSPAVLIHGPRQCGRTTLAQRVGTVEQGRACRTLRAFANGQGMLLTVSRHQF